MKEKEKFGLKEALQSDDTFLAFLKQEAQSEQFRKRRKLIEEGPHPSGEELYDYVLGWLDEEKKRSIREHISFCGICAKEALGIMRIEKEVTEELLDWANNDPVEWASRAAHILVIQKKEIEERLRHEKRFETFTKDLRNWRDGFIMKPEWDTRPEETTQKGSEALFKICLNHGLREFIESRYQPPEITRTRGAVRTRGRAAGGKKPQQLEHRSQVLKTARQRMKELARGVP